MATVTTSLPITRTATPVARVASSDTVFLCGVTTLAFLLLGYHPYAEDGGIYAAAAALRLNPSLFPAEHAFSVGQTGRSLFVPLVAMTARTLHLPLSATLLLLHVLALAATLTAALSLARCLFVQRTAQRWAVLTLAVALGVPVAGTSLYLCDPYLTARSFSTPLLLLGTTAVLQRRWATAALCLALAFAVHPMMAAWAAVLFVFLWAQRSLRPIGTALAATGGLLLLMGALSMYAPSEGAAARAAAMTRDYWFLSGWQWYEVVGLLAPPLLLMAFARRDSLTALQPEYRNLARGAATAVAVAACGSLLFIHTGSRSLLLARVQPLRILHPAYLVMFLLLGGWLSQTHARAVAWTSLALAAVCLTCMQSHTFAASNTFELPGRPSANAWVQAFQWSAANTPVDALFALDAHYTTEPGEDAQLFRAIALRSQLPDAAKDGGIASVMTTLAPEWQAASAAQTELNLATDRERIERLRPRGVTWIILPAAATTQFHCPYINRAAKVCTLH